MTKKQKKMLIRICIAVVLLLIAKFVPMPGVVRIVLFAVTYLVIGYDILKKAAKGIGNGRVFDENFLMAIATLGAIALAVYEKDDGPHRGRRRYAVLPDRRAVPELRGRQEPPEHHCAHGHPPGLCQHRNGRQA